jgi:hypothetical protein
MNAQVHALPACIHGYLYAYLFYMYMLMRMPVLLFT